MISHFSAVCSDFFSRRQVSFIFTEYPLKSPAFLCIVVMLRGKRRNNIGKIVNGKIYI